MLLHESLHIPPKIPLYSLFFTSLFVIIISIISLSYGITIVFQNLYYFPIIIACAFYLRRGFIFSLVLIGVYSLLIALSGPTQSEVYSALARIAIFILVAGVVTWLSSRYSEQASDLMISERKFRRLFDANDAGIALHEVICDSAGKATDYRFIDVNPAYEQMTGLKGYDIIGKTVRTVLPDTEEYWLLTFGEVATTGKTVHFENYSRDLGKYYEGTAYALEPGRFACLIRDITERKTQEQQLKETNAYLENLITHANVPIIIWDPGYHITRVNHAFELLAGRPAGHLEGRHLSILFPTDEAERSMQFIQTTGEGVRWETVEIPIIHQDGSLHTVLWNSSTIYGSDGMTPVATIAQGCDVTTERFLQREKERAAIQIKENIAQLAILNDGIRNPLTLILTYADMAGDEQSAAQIQHEVMRIDEMVNNLDREWVHSGKILDYLRKHDKVAFDFIPTHSPASDTIHSDTTHGQVISSPYVSSHERYIEEIQSRLYSILDSIDAYIYVADMETHDILYLNEPGRRLFGNVIGQKCYASFYGEIGPCEFCTNNKIRDSGSSDCIHMGEFLNPKTGRWYDCRGRSLRWTEGRLVKLEIGTDVTDRKESEEKFRALFGKTQNPILITDEQGNYIDANDAALLFLEVNREELLTKKVWDFSPPGLLEEQKRNHYLFTEKRTLETEYLVNGRIKTLLLNVVPLVHNGQAVIYGIGQDITERKKMEEVLFEQEERYRLALQATNDVIWDFDVIHDSQRWNEAGIAVFGCLLYTSEAETV